LAQSGEIIVKINVHGVSKARREMNPSRKQFLVGVLIVLALLFPLWPSFEKPAGPMDEGSLLVYPELILKGQLPYRDFETFYGPANPFLLSAAYAGFGTNIFVERSVGLIYRALILAAVFALLRNWGTFIAAGGVLITGFLMVPTQLPAYAWWGAMMCALWSLFFIVKPESGWRCFCGGTLAGLAILYRVDLAPAMIASALPLFLLMNAERRWAYLTGAALSLLPFGWLTIAAGPQQIINNLFFFPVVFSSAARHLPVFSAPNFLICLFFAYLVAALLNTIAGWIAIRANRRDVTPRLLLSLALFGLGLTHQAAQRIDLVHVTFAAFISLGMLPLSLVVVLRSSFRNALPTRNEALLSIATVLVLVEAIVPELVGYLRQEIFAASTSRPGGAVFLEQHDRSLPLFSQQQARNIGRLFSQIEKLAIPGQRLFVGPADLRRTNYNDTALYHLLPQLRPATYFLEMNPLSANRPNSRLAADVASADWLVLDHSLDIWNEPNDSTKFGSDAPAKVVQEQFEICGRFDTYELYRRTQAKAAAQAQSRQSLAN
jgi:hypothetical protein